MTRQSHKNRLRLRPHNAKRRAKSQHARSQSQRKRSAFTARLTIDVTPDLRARIKITAFERDVTVAHMLRDLLLKKFPPTKGHRR